MNKNLILNYEKTIFLNNGNSHILQIGDVLTFHNKIYDYQKYEYQLIKIHRESDVILTLMSLDCLAMGHVSLKILNDKKQVIKIKNKKLKNKKTWWKKIQSFFYNGTIYNTLVSEIKFTTHITKMTYFSIIGKRYDTQL